MANAEEQLANFGLNKLEAKIYLFLVGKAPLSVLGIAKGTGLPRTSVYDNLQKLLEQGLVTKSIKYKSQVFGAYPIEILETLVDRERSRLETLEKSLKELKTIASARPSLLSTDVRYYHGEQGFRQMMWNALMAKKELIGYSEMGRVAVVGRKFIQRWDKEMQARGLIDRVIINPKKDTLTHLQREKKEAMTSPHERIRVIEERTLDISGDTTIYNDVFAVCFWKEGEVVGVEIENSGLVKTQKSLFEVLWGQAKPVR